MRTNPATEAAARLGRTARDGARPRRPASPDTPLRRAPVRRRGRSRIRRISERRWKSKTGAPDAPNTACLNSGCRTASSSSVGCSGSSAYGQKRSSGRYTGSSGKTRSGSFEEGTCAQAREMLSCRASRRNRTMAVFRLIPSIEEFLQRSSLKREVETHGRQSIAAAAREAADALRDAMASKRDCRHRSTTRRAGWSGTLAADLSNRLRHHSGESSTRRASSFTRIWDARRSPPWHASARPHSAATPTWNTTWRPERRGHRHVHAERLLCRLTGAEAAAVVNNNAAATLLVLAALASGREVIVSRGELVEIGGGFRVPEVTGAIRRGAA